MVTDRVRMSGYRAALNELVRPGCTVVDLGTGTGVFAIIACQLGAGRVYAIEPAPAIELARTIAAENRQDERIEFLPEISQRVTLPQRVDLIVADVGGVLPFFQHAVPSIIDARERFLAPDGELIPGRDALRLALAEEPDSYAGDRAALAEVPVNMSAATVMAANDWHKSHLSADKLLTEPQDWHTLTYESVASPHASRSVSARVTRSGTAAGICLWFDRALTSNVGYSNAPGEPKTVYGQAFFPLESPVEVASGDEVSVELEARLVDEDYVWRWQTRISDAAAGIKASFEQSTVKSTPVSISRLRRREASHRPQRNEDGEIDALVLSLMDGDTPLEEIADRVATEFPDRFESSRAALHHVARLSETYSR